MDRGSSKMTEQIIEKIEKIEKKHEKKETVRSSIVLKVYRANRRAGESLHYDSIEVPVQRWTTVLDALLYAKAYKDKSIGIRYSCRMASCGSCGMKINGIPRLACYTKISELETSTIECEPLSNFPIIRDLVTDFSLFFNHHKDIQPHIQSNEGVETDTEKKTFSFYQSPEDVDRYLQFSYCIKCGLCNSACPTVGTDLRLSMIDTVYGDVILQAPVAKYVQKE